jgi:hypothetical protein
MRRVEGKKSYGAAPPRSLPQSIHAVLQPDGFPASRNHFDFLGATS